MSSIAVLVVDSMDIGVPVDIISLDAEFVVLSGITVRLTVDVKVVELPPISDVDVKMVDLVLMSGVDVVVRTVLVDD